MEKIGKAFIFFLLHFGLILVLFSVLRFLFFAFNYSYFPSPKAANFIGGIRFDWMTITLIYSPYLLLFPFLFYGQSKLLRGLFIISTVVAVCLNVIDFEYYKFTLKRTTADLFVTQGLAYDLGNLISTFLFDYWYLFVIAGILIWLTSKVYSFINRRYKPTLSLAQSFVFFLILLIIYGMGSRGGLQYRPLNVIQASAYSNAQNIALVLNTPFTIIKSAFKDDIKRVAYFSEKELEKIYSPEITLKGDSTSKRLNVVVIIAESFSKEYVGALNGYKGYTPFLDSLISKSLVFPNAFANGKKSIESLPSIISGIPTLMNTAYITSRFASNRIGSLPSVLANKGYSTAFYHGGENGTMGFKAFSQLAGIESYVGKDEYPLDGDFDGNWGVFDEPFLQFCADNLAKMKQPFFASVFTLSSHHPYTIPAKYKGKFEGGPLPILKSVEYADYSLKRFFEKASEQAWFNETLFVITADHTSQSFTKEYSSAMGIYRIPILYYCPKYLQARNDKRITQHNDIFPSVIDFLNIEADVVSFGNSVFAYKNQPFAISYLNNTYQLIEEDFCLQFFDDKTVAFYNWKNDPQLENNLVLSGNRGYKEYEKKLKAILQQYNNRLMDNKLIP